MGRAAGSEFAGDTDAAIFQTTDHTLSSKDQGHPGEGFLNTKVRLSDLIPSVGRSLSGRLRALGNGIKATGKNAGDRPEGNS